MCCCCYISYIRTGEFISLEEEKRMSLMASLDTPAGSHSASFRFLSSSSGAFLDGSLTTHVECEVRYHYLFSRNLFTCDIFQSLVCLPLSQLV